MGLSNGPNGLKGSYHRGKRSLTTTSAVMIALGTAMNFAPPQASAQTTPTLVAPTVQTILGTQWVVVSSAANLAYIDAYQTSAITAGSSVDYLHANIELLTNIDMSGVVSTWTPFGGNGNSPFSGKFAGEDHTVTGISISGNAADEGFFGTVSGGTIENLGVVDSVAVDRYRSSNAGGLVGLMENGSIFNSYVSGPVSVTTTAASYNTKDAAYAGGLVGEMKGGNISDSYASGGVDVNAKGTANSGLAYVSAVAAGLVGEMLSGSISTSYAEGGIDAHATGSATFGGSVSTVAYAGGLVGDMQSGTIADAYAATYPQATGGLTFSGGLAGYADGSITDAYDIGEQGGSLFTGAVALGGGTASLSGVTPLGGSGMTQQSSYVGFDFNYTWAIGPSSANDALPYLQSMVPALGSTNIFAALPNQQVDEPIPFAGGYVTAWSASGLPSGLTVTTDGMISGTTTQTGLYTVTVTATNQFGATATETYTLDVLRTTASGAIEVGTWTDLVAIDENQSQFLGSTIDLMANVTAPAGGASPNWVPFGQKGTPFTGTFDGHGHYVSGLTIAPAHTEGFFGVLGSGSVVENLGVIGTIPEALSDAGLLVGDAVNAQVTDAYTKGQVSAGSNGADVNLGGLVGITDGTTTISLSYSTADVTAGNNQYSTAGGFVGSVNYGGGSSTIAESFATGKVTGEVGVGGFAGQVSGPPLGDVQNLDVQNSYATGNVSGTANVGGFSGGAGAITDSYATGQVPPSDKFGDIGPFNGNQTGSTESGDYFGPTTSPGPYRGVYGLTASQLTDAASYVGWDFASVWAIDPSGVINHGWPYLRDMYPTIAKPSYSPQPYFPRTVAGSPYQYTPQVSGGSGGDVWSATGLPPGLSLDPATGRISGIPREPGRYTITLTVTDTLALSDSMTYTMDVSAPVAPPVAPLSVQSITLGDATQGSPYDQLLLANGGTQAYTWSLVGGSLPSGLVLNSDGVVQGTPEEPGTYMFTVEVRDAAGNTATATDTLTVEAVTPLRIRTMVLPGATAGNAYSGTLAATGGDGTYNWSLASGRLPRGLMIAANGTLFGTPQSQGMSTFTLRVTDRSGDVATKTFHLFVMPKVLPAFDRVIQVNGQVFSLSPAMVYNQTTYMPIWYVERVLKLAGVNAAWRGNLHGWDLTVNTSSGSFAGVKPHLLYRDHGTPVYVNGVLVLHAPTVAHRDQTDGVMTTYMAIWYVQQVLRSLGITTTWNGHVWNFDLPV